MNLVAQLRKLRPEDLDYVHDPFAKMMFINHLATGVGKHVPQAVLNTWVDEVQKWSTTSQAFYLIGTARAKSNKRYQVDVRFGSVATCYCRRR